MLQNATECGVSGARMADLDEILRNLRLKRERLKADLSEVDKAITMFERAKAELSPDLFSELTPTQRETPNPSPRARNAIAPRDLALAAKDVLLAAGKPMKRGDIVQELSRRGIEIAGKDPNKNLGTILWRHQEMFVTVNALGYWVKDVPLPGVYEPTEE